MKHSILIINFCIFLYSIAASAEVKSQTNFEFDSYKATITRDIWGVPHVHGNKDADAAFGLAFAHAQDDIKNITENMVLYRAEMGLKIGRKGAVSDYLIKALNIRNLIENNYTKVLSPEVRAVIKGYTAGLNYWHSVSNNNKYKSVFPITEYDVVSGFVIQNLFFSGVITEIEKLQNYENSNKQVTAKNKSDLYQAHQKILGSNALALNFKKTDDGSTRLVINSPSRSYLQ